MSSVYLGWAVAAVIALLVTAMLPIGLRHTGSLCHLPYVLVSFQVSNNFFFHLKLRTFCLDNAAAGT